MAGPSARLVTVKTFFGSSLGTISALSVRARYLVQPERSRPLKRSAQLVEEAGGASAARKRTDEMIRAKNNRRMLCEVIILVARSIAKLGGTNKESVR